MTRPGPPPIPDDPGDEGIQAEGSRPARRRAPRPDDEPILLGAEHIQDRPPPPARPTPQRSTELIGREFTIDLGRPWVGFLLAVALLGGLGVASMVASGAYLSFGLAYAAVLAAAFGVFFGRRTTRCLRFTEDAVELTRPDVRLTYGEILEVFAPEHANRPGRNFPIHLLHAHGFHTIPPRVRGDSAAIDAFLRTQPLGVRELPAVAPVLRDFVKQQVALHGPDEVYVYHARLAAPPLVAGRASGVWSCVGLLLGGIGLVVLGIAIRLEAAIGIGIGAALVGLVVGLVVLQNKMARPPIKDWQKVMLVVAPDGLALVQGTLTGELRWRELRGVRMGKGAAAYTAGGRGAVSLPGVHLDVAGATITIVDLYHWPLAHIREQIEKQWNGR